MIRPEVKFFRFVFSFYICFFFLALPASGENLAKTFTLDNGLRVCIKELPSAPVVAINVWVHAGSRNEKPGEEGFSHLIEHMLFKGTASFTVGQLDKEIKKLGASQNAFTAPDYTCYHTLGSKDHFSRLLELESDAILNSTLAGEEFNKEKQVVLEELRMDNDDPDSFSYNLLKETAYKTHPYRHPIVGLKQSLEAATRDSLYNYYRRYYVPSNIWVVIVGDVKTEEALELVKKNFGKAAKAEAPDQKVPEELPQDGKREVRKFGDIQQAYVKMAWHAPGIQSSENYAMDIITTMIGRGKSSRLYKTLVEEERLATNLEASYFTSGDPSLFIINAQLPQGNTRKFVERAKKIIYEFAGKPFQEKEQTDNELQSEFEKVKQQIIAGTIFERENAEAQALAYGHYASLGKLDECDLYTERIDSVTFEDVQRVSKEVFSDKKLSIVFYEPNIATSSFSPERITLENGLKLILKENHSSPLVGIAVQIDAGGLREGKNEAGVANLTAEMLQKGTENRKAEEIARAVESMGTSLTCQAHKSFANIRMVCLTEKFLPSLGLLKEILVQASFPEEEFRKEQEKALEEIKAQQDDLFYFTYYNSLAELFPDHPLGYSTLGIDQQVKKLKRSDVVQFYKKHYIGSGIVVSIVGDFYCSDLKDKLIKLFGEIPTGSPSEFRDVRLPSTDTPREIVGSKNREQAQIIYLSRTFPRSDPKGPSMDVLKNILSGSTSSRLFTNLRDKDSLAYAVWAANVGTAKNGYFFATLSTAVTKLETAKKRLIEELTKVNKEGFSDEEFQDAKSYILGQYALSLVDNISQADTFSSDEFFGLGFDYFKKYPEIIKTVKKQDVINLAKQYLAGKEGYLIGVTKP